MIRQAFLILGIFLYSTLASADNVILLSSGRTQNINNCWAHAGAFMTESLFETSFRKAPVTEIGRDLIRLNIYERFMNVFKTKTPFTGGDIQSELGYTGEYMRVLQKYGLLVRETISSDGVSYDYPYTAEFKYSKTDKSVDMDRAEAFSLQQRLIKENMTVTEAENLIRQTMMKYTLPNEWVITETILNGKKINRLDLFSLLLPSHLHPTRANEEVAVLVLSQENHPDRSLGLVLQDTVAVFVVPKQKDIFSLVRYSLDQGYAASYETTSHAMTFLGYKSLGGQYVYAIADSNTHISWLREAVIARVLDSSTLFYNVAKNELNKLLPNSVMDWDRPKRVKGFVKIK